MSGSRSPVERSGDTLRNSPCQRDIRRTVVEPKRESARSLHPSVGPRSLRRTALRVEESQSCSARVRPRLVGFRTELRVSPISVSFVARRVQYKMIILQLIDACTVWASNG